MKRQRRQYSAEWKAKVALEAVKAQRTVQQIASHYEVHPSLVRHGKKQLLEGAAEIFAEGTKRAAEADGGAEGGVVPADREAAGGSGRAEKKSPGCRVSGAAAMDRSGRRGAAWGAAMRAGGGVALGAVLPAAGAGRREGKQRV